MRITTCLMAIGLGVAVAAADAGAQSPKLEILYNSWNRANISNIGLLRADATPRTLYFKMETVNQNFVWSRFRIAMAVTTRRLKKPVSVPGIGNLEVDLATLIHYDGAMKTKHVHDYFDGREWHHQVLAWTKVPPIPESMVGTPIFVQFVANEGPPARNWIASQAYPARRESMMLLLPK